MNRLLIFLSLFTALLLSSCRDDLLYDDHDLGEGEANVELTVQFLPLLDRQLATRASGTAINEIKTVSIVIYNKFDQLYKVYNPGDPDISGFQPYDTDIMMNNQDGTPVKRSTREAKGIIRNLPYGRYKIYAVANVPDLSKADCETPDKLKSLEYEWKADVTQNAQMFGYFQQTRDNEAVNRAFDFDAPTIEVGEPDTELHCWLRRLASKVTVDFDPSGLEQSVYVYIKSVKIRDIPKTCLLGKNNTPTSRSQLTLRGDSLIYNAQGNFVASASSDYHDWLQLSKGSGIKGSDHSDTAEALYFYENMQGNHSDEPDKYNKNQDKTQVGTNIKFDGQPDFKDEVKYGTYVEIEAHYVSTNAKNPTSGPIVYRFMLGKDTDFDYNAQRNHHYKLTLAFKGWANQPDWHINYEEEDPGILAPDVFYVSYLYNTKAMMPVKINGNCTGLTAEIIENNWCPYQANKNPDSPQVPPQGSQNTDFTWNRPAYDRFNLDPSDNHAYLGFLALCTYTDSNGNIPKNIITNYNFADGENAFAALKKDYESHHQNFQSYNMTPDSHNVGLNGYEVKNLNSPAEDKAMHSPVTHSAADSRVVTIPLWTRNKTMINESGFTGNNPYEHFQRMAKVKLVATFDLNGHTVTREKVVTVIQQRRVVNPKGVWRSSTNTNTFHVAVSRLESPGVATFTQAQSEGEWRAYIEKSSGDAAISISGGNGTRGDTILGNTGTTVNFDINFASEANVGNPRYAIVRVDYHGFTCVHRILVRQGYEEPTQLVSNGANWSSFSLFYADADWDTTGGTVSGVLTASPLALGSFFKLKNYRRSILIRNNSTYGPLAPPNGGVFLCGDNQRHTWANISTGTSSTTAGWNHFSIKVNNTTHTYRVPDYKDFAALDNLDFAFGVFYADGATGTATTTTEAYEFDDPNHDNLGGKGSNRGMRCVCVYNSSNAKQIIFPLGARGMGRRTQFNVQRPANERSNWYGMLRYSDVSELLGPTNWNGTATPNNIYRPIPYDLPRCPGAIYWIDKRVTNGHSAGNDCYGWDMNYFSFDFGHYTANNVNDACPIKLIRVN